MTHMSDPVGAAQNKMRELLQDIFKDDAFIMDLSTPEGVLAWAKSVMPPRLRDQITKAEIIDGVLHIALSPPLEYIIVHITKEDPGSA